MKINKKIIIFICLVLILSIGCSTKSIEDNSNVSIENHIPYIDENYDEINNSIINERYENIKKEELTYDTKEYKKENVETVTQIHLADSIKNDINYKDILLGFTYYSEINPCSLNYDEAIELIEKVLPDDIKKVDSTIDEDVNKEYIYYESSKGNFRVALCYEYEFNNENVQVANKNKICVIDYSKEIKQ